jgi:transcriptional regulator with XRE-family HTH domain
MEHALTRYRKAQSLTVEAFGNLIGASKGTVSKWENGTIPRPEYMRKISEATNNAVTAGDWYVVEAAE